MTTVSRAVVVTHNGDFEAFDLGNCFGSSSKTVDLTVLRNWLAKRLDAPPPSAGDSVVAAGLLELLFTAGDPFASVRLAFVALEHADIGADPAPGKVLQAAASVLTSTLLELERAVSSELSYSLNGMLTADTRNQHILRIVNVYASALQSQSLVASYLASRGGLDYMTAAVASTAVRAFFEADLRSATRRFLRHAHGSFGLVVSTSLAPCALVIASIKQPMAIGVGRGFVVYGSERAALHAGVIGEKLIARRILGEGEVVWFAPSVHDCLPVCACRMAAATTTDDLPFRALTFSATSDGRPADFDMCARNALIMPPVEPASFQGDVVGKDLADIPRALRHIRDTFEDGESFNSRTVAKLAEALFPEPAAQRVIDLLVVAVESSLWVGEQWAANMRSAFPKLRVVVASANKVLASLTAVANDATCGAQTPGSTVFPSGYSPAASVRGAVALIISHSGQT